MLSNLRASEGKFFQNEPVTRGLQTQIRSSAWLEHYTDNVGVSSSNLLGSTATAEASA